MARGDADQRNDDGSPTRGGRRPVRQERRVAAWIGASIVIRGDLTSSEDMTIAGRVEGDVAVPDNQLVIAPNAHIAGNIVARAVAVLGHVAGDINAQQSMEIGETGSVIGDVVTPRLTVAEGAVLHGRADVRQDRTGGAGAGHRAGHPEAAAATDAGPEQSAGPDQSASPDRGDRSAAEGQPTAAEAR